jgi:hypothetical protein
MQANAKAKATRTAKPYSLHWDPFSGFRNHPDIEGVTDPRKRVDAKINSRVLVKLPLAVLMAGGLPAVSPLPFL